MNKSHLFFGIEEVDNYYNDFLTAKDAIAKKSEIM